MLWLGKNDVPFSIIFTKSDKLKQRELAKNIKAYEEELFNYWEEIPTYFITSSERKTGKDKVLSYVDEINPLFEKC